MLAAQDIHVMPMLRAAFCQQQVVVAVLLIDMRSFGIAPAKTYSQKMDLTELFARRHIDLADLDLALLPEKVTLALVEEQCRVAATNTEIDINGVRPFAIRVVGIDVEMAAGGEHCRHHIEPALMIADGGGIDACLLVHPLDSDLRLACEAGTHLFPVNQIFAMKHGNTWVILECAVHQIEIIACPTH